MDVGSAETESSRGKTFVFYQCSDQLLLTGRRTACEDRAWQTLLSQTIPFHSMCLHFTIQIPP